ncbi:hypothetical protein [Peribacillus simplex]|uniref:hypothetical protein n=1 Tax=Peribacillus simplex TaxID=1478 RepID=UPI0012D8A9A7|nr:hypothetical protein [Peribacillus simplex]
MQPTKSTSRVFLAANSPAIYGCSLGRIRFFTPAFTTHGYAVGGRQYVGHELERLIFWFMKLWDDKRHEVPNML